MKQSTSFIYMILYDEVCFFIFFLYIKKEKEKVKGRLYSGFLLSLGGYFTCHIFSCPDFEYYGDLLSISLIKFGMYLDISILSIESSKLKIVRSPNMLQLPSSSNG